jgi:PIN domain nuclease of toxin-antitoxin system
MRLLADTHVLIWWLDDSRELPTPMRDAIAGDRNEVVASVASLVEVAVKRSLGKLRIRALDRDFLEGQGVNILPITAEHASALEDLPLHHRDPFDRILVAQAQVEDLVFLTVDRQLNDYDYRRLPDSRRS